MRMLFVHEGREWSGSARAFTDAARGLAQRGHSVRMVVMPESTVEQIVSHMVTPLQGKASVGIEAMPLSQPWFVAAVRLRALLKLHSIEVVFVHTNREHLIASLASWFGARARIVRRVPVGERVTRTFQGRVATWLTPTCYMFASETDARSARLPKGAALTSVVQIGVYVPDLASFPPITPDLEREYIACVHDRSSRNRAATAIRTLAKLVPRHSGLRLILIGEGAYDDDLRMQAAALRVLNRITFLGERDDALHVMRTTRLGWVVADHDSAAYALLDFMALEIPVLAGEQSVAESYVLSDITGRLLPSDDAHATAATVAELLVDEATRANMGEAARARVQREFSLDRMLDGIDETAARLTTLRRRQ